MTAALEGGEWLAARPGRTLPPGKTRHPFYRRLCGPQGRSGRAENKSSHYPTKKEKKRERERERERDKAPHQNLSRSINLRLSTSKDNDSFPSVACFKKKHLYSSTRGGHPVVLVRINLFIVKLQNNYRQHNNIHLLSWSLLLHVSTPESHH